MERARYEEKRARRQFDAVEPENRLVASELEARWNVALAQVAEAEARLAAAAKTSEPLSEPQKQQLTTLSEDLMALWNHPEAPIQLKKRILRTVLTEIVIDNEADSATHHLRLHWAGGVHTELRVERNKSGQHRHNFTRQLRIPRAIDLPHAARAKLDGDFVRAGTGSGPGSEYMEFLRKNLVDGGNWWG